MCLLMRVSPSLRGRGLKSVCVSVVVSVPLVALFTRAWIEIAVDGYTKGTDDVALFTRAWIEINLISFRYIR